MIHGQAAFHVVADLRAMIDDGELERAAYHFRDLRELLRQRDDSRMSEPLTELEAALERQDLGTARRAFSTLLALL
jgi:hypothetical protein